jgi:NAD(P)-dependent dehydrogenase (short-subunit alcohol dehydrogenase family)
VTGATSGIDRAVALQLARDGFDVIVHGRDATRGAQTVDEINAAGGVSSKDNEARETSASPCVF